MYDVGIDINYFYINVLCVLSVLKCILQIIMQLSWYHFKWENVG